MPLRRARCRGSPRSERAGVEVPQPAVRNLVDPLRSSGYMRVSARIPPACGAVAQLGERLNGIQEVEGSTPFGSTPAIGACAATARSRKGLPVDWDRTFGGDALHGAGTSCSWTKRGQCRRRAGALARKLTEV